MAKKEGSDQIGGITLSAIPEPGIVVKENGVFVAKPYITYALGDLQVAYIQGNLITTSAGEGDFTVTGTENVVIDGSAIDLGSTSATTISIGNASSTTTISGTLIIDGTLQAGAGLINTQTGTTYELVLTDAGKLVTLSNADPVVVTVPVNAQVPFSVGSQVDLVQLGAGAVSIESGGDGAVTLYAQDGNLTVAAQYVGVTLKKLAADTWLLIGNLIA